MSARIASGLATARDCESGASRDELSEVRHLGFPLIEQVRGR